jgi:glucose/mannose-6-phosphate isomerase
MDLDDLELFQRVDADRMIDYINALPDQLYDSWIYGQSLTLPAQISSAKKIIICGMGGSAISGDLLATLSRDISQCPIMVNRTYDLPAHVNQDNTFVIALSHSGNTEEVLSAVGQAIDRGSQLLAITTGGKLADKVEDAGGTVWAYEYPSLPRAAVGWLYGLVLAACSQAELIPDQGSAVQEAVRLMEKTRSVIAPDIPAAKNPAKRIAGQMVGRTVVIWGAGLLTPVARRWKTQLNENAKSRAYYDELPELNHNSVVGIKFPADLNENHRYAIVQLCSEKYDHPRVAVRHRVTADVLREQGCVTDTIQARGESRLANQFSLIQFGDYVSYYVAMANEVDPSPIPNIDILKAKLEQAVI